MWVSVELMRARLVRYRRLRSRRKSAHSGEMPEFVAAIALSVRVRAAIAVIVGRTAALTDAARCLRRRRSCAKRLLVRLLEGRIAGSSRGVVWRLMSRSLRRLLKRAEVNRGVRSRSANRAIDLFLGRFEYLSDRERLLQSGDVGVTADVFHHALAIQSSNELIAERLIESCAELAGVGFAAELSEVVSDGLIVSLTKLSESEALRYRVVFRSILVSHHLHQIVEGAGGGSVWK